MDWYLKRLSEFGEKVAFQDEKGETTYAELILMVDLFQKYLLTTGVKPGDVVIAEGRSNSTLFAALVAIMSYRAVAVPITEQSPISTEIATEIASANFHLLVNENKMTRIDTEVIPNEPGLLLELKREGLGGVILYSSGSTGIPKAILYDSTTLLKKFEAVKEPINALLFLMLDHFGGLNTVFSISSCGGTAITLKDRNVETVCAAIEKYSVKILPVTPSFLRLLILSKAKQRYDISSLRKITFGTEPMTQTTLDQVRNNFPGVELQQTYGLSEVGVLRSKSQSDGSLWMKIGGDGFEWKVKNGTLWIRSAFQMRGYLNSKPEIDDDGFFNTQDEVLVDGEFIRIIGRVTDVLNVGGEKVYPAEIESLIENLENIVGVSAYAEPNSLLGQVIAVDVQLEHPEELSLLRKRIRDACTKSLGRGKAPSKVRIVQEIILSSRLKKSRGQQ
jgi:acyl-CoA synthetase (AMP-forming)/AMP-acid ligase II